MYSCDDWKGKLPLAQVFAEPFFRSITGVVQVIVRNLEKNTNCVQQGYTITDDKLLSKLMLETRDCLW